MKSRTWLRTLALAGVAGLTVTGASAVAAQATPPPGSCASYRDCGDVGGHISRDSVIQRASIWLNPQQFYSQDVANAYNGTGQNKNKKWRRDCSGYVSMAWRLQGSAPSYGRNTASLDEISKEIGFRALKRGDILLDGDGGPGYSAHVVIFAKWVKAKGGDFYMIEENPAYGGAKRHKASEVSYLKNGGIKGRADAGDNFVPRRYKKITEK